MTGYVVLPKYHDNHTKEVEMGGKCTCERENKRMQSLVLIPKHRWWDKSKMDVLWTEFV